MCNLHPMVLGARMTTHQAAAYASGNGAVPSAQRDVPYPPQAPACLPCKRSKPQPRSAARPAVPALLLLLLLPPPLPPSLLPSRLCSLPSRRLHPLAATALPAPSQPADSAALRETLGDRVRARQAGQVAV